MTTFPESHRDLLDAQVATLATIDDNGYPQVTAVWFVHDDGELRVSLNTTRHKTKNLAKRPHCSLFILDVANPQRYLEVRGNAKIEPDPDYEFAAKVTAKYGLDLRNIDQPGESRVCVTIEPLKVYVRTPPR